MKKTMILLSAFALNSFAGEYLLKLPKNYNEKSLKSYDTKEIVKTSFGTYALVASNQKLNELKSDDYLYAEENAMYSIALEEDKKRAQKRDLSFLDSSIGDTDFRRQWGLQNIGTNYGYFFWGGKKGTDINAIEAWKTTVGSKDVKIAVIDTGVDYNHVDLKDNILINLAEKNGTPGVDDDGNGLVDDIYGYDFANKDNDPVDDHGHGTHCAGVIGAAHNSIGIRGVMANVSILPIKFLKKNGSGELIGAIKSIDYAIKRGVDIMSNSWGGGQTSKALEEAVEAASNAGIIFVAAAGNSSSNNDRKSIYPANYKSESVITVAAIGGRAKKPGFSNYGKKTVHVFAPGVDIYSTVQNNRYKEMSGTSMAAPHVSGVIGLLYSMERGLSVAEVKERVLKATTMPYAIKGMSQAGLISAKKILE